MINTKITCPSCGATFDIKDIKNQIKSLILEELEFKIDKVLEQI